MDPIGIMALVFIIAVVIKILVVLINPKSWVGLMKKTWSSPLVTTILSIILAAITLYYLLQTLTIIQIFAVMLFTGFVAAIGVSVYSKEITKIAEKILKDKKLLKKVWLPLIIWIILALWGIKELFAA